ncbi:hypothetical protein NliqN6_0731 [Naganishia liquefaciens]|uniref:Major facilitator superfamily (MFS) profile domain-containing protein n=1 Tax=Naganishia liquefaciens TaxID=104408 RepID=A0A8H3TNX8_9TREE|nr:hypothetical protein NliqN6_0731 [Naganishia liquefaciens]
MSPRPRGRSFGHQTLANSASSLNRTPSALSRIRTPLEHVDSIVVYEEDHDPHDSPSTSRNVSPSRVNNNARLTGYPLASPLHEEEERPDHHVGRTFTEASSDGTIAAGSEYHGATADPSNTSDPEKQIRQRQGWTGERNDADERARMRAVEKQEKEPRAKEKIVEEGGVSDPRTRKWKDDIVTFNTKDDPDNPKNWSYRRKVLITMLFGTTTMCSTFASSVFSSASPYISEEYGVGRQVVVLGISLFIAGYILGPLLWSSLSEQYGRKMTILVPVFIFMCFTAATATAKDLQTIFITRFFGGVFASSPVTIVGGGLSDMFDQKER